MINVLVTGGAGFIGSNLVSELLKLETYNVFVFDNLSTGRITNLPINHPNLKFYQLDLLSDFKNFSSSVSKQNESFSENQAYSLIEASNTVIVLIMYHYLDFRSIFFLICVKESRTLFY